MNKILKWMNNNLLSISYKIWKEDYDSVFDKIKPELRKYWLSIKCPIYSMEISLIIFLFALLIPLLFNYASALRDIFPILLLQIFVAFFLLVFILNLVNILLNRNHYENYIDEKYLEMSKKGEVRLKRK